MVAAHHAERLARRQVTAELVEHEPEPRLLRRPQLRLLVCGTHREHPHRPGDQQVLSDELLGGVLALGGVGAEQRVQRAPLELPARLLQLLAPVHRRADLRRAALGELAVVGLSDSSASISHR